ncbi:DNA translocase FtsK [uncultured Rhodospira sp.]|uniref:DNA translocase FtsK n=1 Tax=uncultured Rhodospira sp. TaxID=1936189 RepID=UPI0026349B96|nr:DNA translocase FtsK [uncultured Rhodospira sp.]
MPLTPPSPSNDMAETDVLTADEFNLWCALNNMPFRMTEHVWPDGATEWDVEVHPGQEAQTVAYGTGQSDEAAAAAMAFAFVAGVDWADAAHRAAREALEEGDPDGEGEDDRPMPAVPLGAAFRAPEAALAAPVEEDAESDLPDEADTADTAPADAETAWQDDAWTQDDVEDAADDEAWEAPDWTDDAETPEDRAPAPDEAPPGYRPPSLDVLQDPADDPERVLDEKALADRARALETVLRNFKVRGEIMQVHQGPVITLYELEPIPGTKSSTVINLADDIARSMSAVTARIAVVPGRSVIGIELPNDSRETVYLKGILTAPAFADTAAKLPLALGKGIDGNPFVVDLSRMPHLLIAGTTGSGKSVGINAMILSLLSRMSPERCRLIMVDPKMLELSVYDGIPHLLTPVVTDPNKAVMALKWAVREMESRYRAMSAVGVRNIEGFNQRMREAQANGEVITRPVQVGYDRQAKEPIIEERPMDLKTLPYIVVVVDEMADLMLVAGKEIEAVIQRLAQMARAAGIHLIMATQRPSVDVITGTIKANFPTRISFQVTSKIDSRTILGEAGAEQLVGQGDMLYMTAGGRITRVHGAFVSDREVEALVSQLKDQGEPEYVHSIIEEDEDGAPVVDDTGPAGGDTDGGFGESSGDHLYDQAVALVLRENKVSVSFIQRCLQIGYNRSARIVERMESEGLISPANHVGKREILARGRMGGDPGGDY